VLAKAGLKAKLRSGVGARQKAAEQGFAIGSPIPLFNTEALAPAADFPESNRGLFQIELGIVPVAYCNERLWNQMIPS
jgi:hypothetical protein